MSEPTDAPGGSADFQTRFPEMEPVRSMPSLARMNGIGLTFVGSWEPDAATATYVTCHCFTFFFVPLLVIGAYRVAYLDGGYFVLGKVPLSGLAKFWNVLVILGLFAAVGFVSWDAYTKTPNYIAEKQLAEANRLAAAGQAGAAAKVFHTVAVGPSDRTSVGAQQLRQLLDEPATRASGPEAAVVFKELVLLKQERPNLVGDDLLQLGTALAEQNQANPAAALALLEMVEPLTAEPLSVLRKEQVLLERLTTEQPGTLELDTKLASRIARLDPTRASDAKCEALLTPHRDKLGASDGARLLGHIYTQQGKFDEAHKLLTPYVEGRLPRFHAAERAYLQSVDALRDRTIQQIRVNNAPDFPMERFKSADEEAKGEIFREYFSDKLKRDVGLNGQRANLRAESVVVPVTIDLGIVLLRRAQNQADEAARKADLEKAEKMFLAVRDHAGADDTYRLFLGQVYYWLGKHTEGRKLFDELLDANKHTTEIRLSVAAVLREVGATGEARAMAEEAYRAETDPKQKFQAASLRRVLSTTLDDSIDWLQKCDLSFPMIKADLAWAQGMKAATANQTAEAARLYQTALAIYDTCPEDVGSLNNSALICFSIFRLTGDRAQFDKGVLKLDKALALKPSDSILLRNAAEALSGAALTDLIGTRIDLAVLKRNGSVGLLHYLYGDEAGRKAVVAQVRQHPGLAKAIASYDRLLVLAPKRADSYAELNTIYSFTNDLKPLRGVAQRLGGVEVDHSAQNRHLLDYFAGKDADKSLQDARASLQHARDQLAVVQARPARDATFAVATGECTSTIIALDMLGEPVDMDELVTLAEQAHAAAPSSATRVGLQGALLTRASRRLARTSPAYAELLPDGKRSLGTALVIAVALKPGHPARSQVRADADVKRCVVLIEEGRRLQPLESSPWACAVLRGVESPQAAAAAHATFDDEFEQLERAVELRLNPLSVSAAYAVYWALDFAGKHAEGVAVLKALEKQGVPMVYETE